MSERHPHLAAVAWVGVPFVLYLVALRHFWFNAPIWDDYDAVLLSVLKLGDAQSPLEWLRVLVSQHNEHRIAFPRLVAWLCDKIAGGIDFRLLTLAANFAWLGILALLWAELRHVLRPAAFAAAALLLLNLTYYEASLLPMSGLSNLWVVLFAFASLFHALRDGATNAALGLAFGAAAVVTQASGLIVLPLAAAFCLLRGLRTRGALYGVVALVLGSVYFIGYVRPAQHPALLFALSHPWDALQVFLLIAGGVFPNVNDSISVAIVLLVAIAWALRRGLWRSSPVACAWIAFILASAALITVGRAGFGIFHASRYAIYGSTLMALAVLSIATVTAPWKRPANAALVIACAGMFLWVSSASLQSARDFTFRARLLTKAQPQAPGIDTDPYFGVLYPAAPHAYRILDAAERRGVWRAREEPVYPTAIRRESAIPDSLLEAGRVDRIDRSGRQVKVWGWSHLPATIPGRVFAIGADDEPVASRMRIPSRPDVAVATGVPALALAGFDLNLEYGSEEAAERAVTSLCVLAEAPGHGVRVLGGAPGCPKVAPSGQEASGG